MAKNTYKSKKEGQFLLYIIGGFGVAFVGLILALVIYNSSNPTLDYSDMDQVDSFLETMTQSEDAYLVYFYSETCPACVTIKRDMLSFADNNTFDVAVYFVDLQRVNLPPNYLDYMPAYGGTPHVEIVVNGEYINEAASGSRNVTDLLNEINSGLNNYLN